MQTKQNFLTRSCQLIFERAAVLVAEQLCSFVPTRHYNPSNAHCKKMKQLFQTERRTTATEKLFSILKSPLFLLGIVLLTTGIFAVNIRPHQQETTIPTSPKAEWSYTAKNFSVGYVPSGFRVIEENSTTSMEYVRFAKNEDYFSVSVNLPHALIQIDTENATLENLTVNGYEAIISIKPEIKILLWHTDKYVFRVSGTLEKEKLLRIAESIHCWKKNPTLD